MGVCIMYRLPERLTQCCHQCKPYWTSSNRNHIVQLRRPFRRSVTSPASTFVIDEVFQPEWSRSFHAAAADGGIRMSDERQEMVGDVDIMTC
jgi:hypothetical protein